MHKRCKSQAALISGRHGVKVENARNLLVNATTSAVGVNSSGVFVKIDLILEELPEISSALNTRQIVNLGIVIPEFLKQLENKRPLLESLLDQLLVNEGDSETADSENKSKGKPASKKSSKGKGVKRR